MASVTICSDFWSTSPTATRTKNVVHWRRKWQTPMNQGKLEVVKQEMARVNVDILGISELKWTGMGEFHADDHYIYYCGQESLGRNGVASPHSQ